MMRTKLKAITINAVKPSQKQAGLVYPKNSYFVQGKISSGSDIDIPIAVIAVSDRYSRNEIVDTYMMNRPGGYAMYLPPGKYRFYVFADINGNLLFESDELVGRNNDFDYVTIGKGQKDSKVVMDVDIKISLDKQGKITFPVKIKARRNLKSFNMSGVITTLDDPVFSPKVGYIGHYRPTDFIDIVPSFLFGLEGDTVRIPIIFVHGIEASPAAWKYIVERLDRDRFQPWFFYYPSGDSLDKNGEILYTIMERYMSDYDTVIITAHSMGGLVAKSTISRYNVKRRSDYLKMYVSFCTPYGGSETTAFATGKSPVTAPSWNDIAAGSDFLEKLSKEDFPTHVGFHLFFAYNNDDLVNFGRQDDGTISLSSQLEQNAQESAARIYGFDETHLSILSSEKAVEKYFEVLSTLEE